MKSKYLFYVMAASLALASCSDEEFGYGENAAQQKGDMVSVEELNLVFTKTGADAQTRAEWAEKEGGNGLEFQWTSKDDAIGMVYTGQGGKFGTTNYKFAADSLKFDVDIVEVKTEPDKSNATGLFYPILDKYDGLELGEANYINYQLKSGKVEAEFTASLGHSATAKFETVNDYLLKGYYVAYYPFDGDYKNAGELIPVKSPKEIKVGKDSEVTTIASNDESARADSIKKFNLQAVRESTFSYSAPVEVKAGKQVTEFALKNLSSVLRIKIANEAELADVKELKSVVLRTKGKDAFVVKGKLNNPSAAPSADVITVDEKEGKTATLFVRYGNANYLRLLASKKASDKDSVEVCFPVLPTMLASDGIEVILIDKDDKACVLEAKFKTTGVTLPAGKRINLSTKVTKDTKFNQSFVTTAQDLQKAITDTKSLTTLTTINLLGDITADTLKMVGTSKDDWKGGVTIVASAGSKLTLKNPNISLFNSEDAEPQPIRLTIKAPLAIEDTLSTIQGTVALNGETTIDGRLTLGYAKSTGEHYSGQLVIGGKTTILPGATLIAAYAKRYGVTVNKNAQLIIAKSEDGKKVGKFINGNFKYGPIAGYQYSDGYVQYKSDLTIEGAMTVDGVLEDGGDTQIKGGKMIINGTVTNRNTLNVTNSGTIEVNGKFFNELTDTVTNSYGNPGNIKIETGKLTVNAEGEIYNKSSLNCMGTFVNNGTFFDYVGSVYGGVPYTSNGAYACYVNSAIRLTEAYKRLNQYAKDKFQKIILQKGSYDLTTDKKAAANVNFENSDSITISKAEIINSLKVNKGMVTIAGNLKIAGAAINTQPVVPLNIVKDGKITFNNNIEVKIKGAIVNAGTFDLLNAKTATDLPANVYCTSADVTKGAWTNYPLVIADGSFWTE